MGCGCGKQKNTAELEQIAHNEEDVSTSYASMIGDRYVKFEATLPFAKTLIWGYEKNLKEAAERNEGENKDYVTIDNLRLEFVT